MYIKALKLYGFLSYRELTTLNFCPGLNVIVGANGSGKSSLTTAIRFVMGDGSIDRISCLHQGVDSRESLGYVEILLDTSDQAFTGFEGPEVSIRRSFSADKDEIILNGHRTTKRNLINKLEAAGFSKSNPYYFVKQHEVSTLTGMSEQERLLLLKEVAGTRVYDEKKSQALKKLNETSQKKRSIDDILTVIKRRLDELKEEKDQLDVVLRLESDRSSLENVMLGKSLANNSEKIDSLTEHLNSFLSQYSKLQQENNQTKQEISRIEREISVAQAKIETLFEVESISEKRLLDTQQALNLAAMKKSGKIKISENDEIAQEDYESRMQALRTKLCTQEERLGTLTLESTKIVNKIHQANLDGVQCHKSILRLHRETGNSLATDLEEGSFTSDSGDSFPYGSNSGYLQQQIVDLQDKMRTAVEELRAFEAEMRLLDTEKQSHLTRKMEFHRSKKSNSFSALDEKEREKNIALKQLFECQIHLESLQKEKYLLAGKLTATMNPAQISACKVASQWVAQSPGKDHLFFGMLLENIDVSPEHMRAVETVAGNQLLNFLVKDQQIALSLAAYIKEKGESSAVITPLEDLKQAGKEPAQQFMEQRDLSVMQLTDLVECSAQVRPAMEQVFGNFLFFDSSDLKVPESEYYKGFNIVNRDGDIVSKNNFLSGGNPRNQLRLEIQAGINEIEKKIERRKSEVAEWERVLSNLGREISEMINDSANQEKEKWEIDNRLAELVYDFSVIECSADETRKRIKLIEAEIAYVREQQMISTNEIQNGKNEVELSKTDSDEAKNEQLRFFTRRIRDIEESRETLERDLDKVNLDITELKMEIENCTKKDISLLQKEYEEHLAPDTFAIPHSSGVFGIFHPESPELKLSIDKILEDLKTQKDERKELMSKIENDKKNLFRLNATQIETQRTLNDLEFSISAVEEKLSDLFQEKEELNSKLSSGGLISADANEALSSFSYNELRKNLMEINEKLTKIGDVNRKASDQYLNFLQEGEDLSDKRSKLYESEKAILQLMGVLDKQKEKILRQTFENLSDNFSKVFNEIVRGVEAKLLLNVPNLEFQDPTSPVEGGSSSSAFPDIDTNFPDSGIRIQVRFPTQQRCMPVETLSGGQKCLTALSLLIALQRVDSAPFYVLDEIDANLDGPSRISVSQLIKKQALTNQLVVVSHKRELIEVGDCFVKTVNVNQRTIATITTLEDALGISLGHNHGLEPEAGSAQG